MNTATGMLDWGVPARKNSGRCQAPQTSPMMTLARRQPILERSAGVM